MDPQYNIYFGGQVLDGHQPAAVREALGKLFKADDATLDRIKLAMRMCGQKQDSG